MLARVELVRSGTYGSVCDASCKEQAAVGRQKGLHTRLSVN